VKSFIKPELRIPVACNMHAWMQAFVHVIDHPYFAVTGPDGSFSIKGLPPGDYEVSVAHETTKYPVEPAAAVPVKLGAGETKRLEFAYKGD